MGRVSAYRTLRENVVEEIRLKILNQEFKPGMRIVEQNLSDELGVSRGPIREALRQLEEEGMIEYTRNVGCRVKEITVEDIFEIYLLRSTYEKLAVKLYKGKFSEDDLNQMDNELDLMRELGDEDFGQLLSHDTNFHQVIVEKAEYGRLLKAWKALDYGNIVCCYAGKSDQKEIAERQYEIHKRLLDVCKTQNEEMICEAITEHYMGTVKRFLREKGIPENDFTFYM